MCGEIKPVKQFHKCRLSKGGRNTICKDCRSERGKEKYLDKKKVGCVVCGKEPVSGHPLCELCWMKRTARRMKVDVDVAVSSWRDECPYTGETLSAYNAAWRGQWVSKNMAKVVDIVGWSGVDDITLERMENG